MQRLSPTLVSITAVILLLTGGGEASTTINCPTTSTAILLDQSNTHANGYTVPSGWSLSLPYGFSLSQAEILHGSPNDTLLCRYAVSEGNTALHIYVQMGRQKPKNTCVLTTNKKGFKCN